MRAIRFAILALPLLSISTAFAAIQVPGPITAEAAEPGGATVTYQVSGSTPGSQDDENGRPLTSVVVTCSPPSGSLFPLGTTTVQCTGNDGSSGSFTVTVVDTTAPVLDLPRSFTVQTTSPSGVVVTYNTSARDAVDGVVAVQCTPPSGSFFPVGTTAVTCTAADARGNRATGSFDVSVITTAPPPQPLQDIIAEATGPGGAVVTYSVSSSGSGGDDFDGRPGGSVSCSPASGSLFPLGTTTVVCTSGNFSVRVVDTTAPSLTLPSSITVTATSASGAVVTWAATANDLVDGSVAVTCTPSSGSMFPVGTTNVQCTASDSRNNAAMGSFVVTVNPPPAFEINVTATPDTLWPPDHKMVPVVISVTAANGANVTAQIISVSVNEVDNNNTSPDWVITGALKLDLRAERNDGSQQRVYTITVDAVDGNGTHATGSVNVAVTNSGSSTSAGGAATTPARRRAAGGGG